MLKRLTIKAKLTLTVALALLFVAAVGGVGLYGVSQMGDVVADVTETALPATQMLLNIDRDMQQALVGLHTSDVMTYRTNVGQILDRWKEYKALPTNGLAVEAKQRDFEQEFDHWRTAADAIVPLIEQGRPEAPAKISGAVQKFEAARGVLDTLYGDYEAFAEAKLSQASAVRQSVPRLILLGTALALVLGAAVAWVTGTSISRALGALTDRVRDVVEGEGDLTRRIAMTAQDETGVLAGLFNRFLEQMAGLVRTVADGAHRAASSAGQLSQTMADLTRVAGNVNQAAQQSALAAANQAEVAQRSHEVVSELRTAIMQIAGGAQEQAISTQQSSTVIHQMVAAVDDVANRAENVAGRAEAATARARSGGEVVTRTVEGMQRIRQTVFASSAQVSELGRLSEQIGAITGVITGIADQTNLLALNAAIEAARAGEHGRGFSVVAEEVRKLAELAGRSAGEIAQLVGRIQHSVREAVRGMESGTAEVEQGARLAADAGQALSEIMALVEQTGQEVQAITAASTQLAGFTRQVMESANSVAAVTQENTAAAEEMAAGSDHVIRSVSEIAAMSEENAAAAEEVTASTEEIAGGAERIASAARELAGVAKALSDEVGRFKT